MKLFRIRVILFTGVFIFGLKSIMHAQIVKMYVAMDELERPGNLFLAGGDYLNVCLLIGNNNVFQLFAEGGDGLNTLPYYRFTFSTGVYRRKGKVITLTDTINDYTFVFKEDKFHRLGCIKGFKILRDYMWRDRSVNYRKIPVDAYRDKNYDLSVLKGNFKRRLHNRDLHIKLLDSKNIIGKYEQFGLTIIFSQDVKVGYVFKMYFGGVLFTAGTWKYKLGRIDLFDPYFKHTYYCYVKDDSSLYYFNFPIIHSSEVDELLLKKVRN